MIKVKRILPRVGLFCLMVLVGLICFYPMVSLLFNSVLKPNYLPRGILSRISHISLGQYYESLFENSKFLRGLLNSALMAFSITIGQVAISIPAAFALEKYKIPGKEILFGVYLILVLLPYQVLQLPHYLLMKEWELMDTQISIILPNIFSTIGVCILRQGMRYVDNSVLDAAKIDGCGDFRLLSKMAIPGAEPSIVAAALLIFLDSWNMVEAPKIFLTSVDKMPISVIFNSVSGTGRNYAMGVLCLIIPFLLFGLFAEKLKSFIDTV